MLAVVASDPLALLEHQDSGLGTPSRSHAHHIGFCISVDHIDTTSIPPLQNYLKRPSDWTTRRKPDGRSHAIESVDIRDGSLWLDTKMSGGHWNQVETGY